MTSNDVAKILVCGKRLVNLVNLVNFGLKNVLPNLYNNKYNNFWKFLIKHPKLFKILNIVEKTIWNINFTIWKIMKNSSKIFGNLKNIETF